MRALLDNPNVHVRGSAGAQLKSVPGSLGAGRRRSPSVSASGVALNRATIFALAAMYCRAGVQFKLASGQFTPEEDYLLFCRIERRTFPVQ
jgi:hypothetical protein